MYDLEKFHSRLKTHEKYYKANGYKKLVRLLKKEPVK